MASGYTDLLRITDASTPPEQRLVGMRSFAEELQWNPNYEIQGTFGVEAVSGHLIVDHGLENTAAISFLKSPYRAAELDNTQLRALLTISYNNLIEWHLFVSGTDVRWVNNLADRNVDLEADRVHFLNSSNFLNYLSAAHLDEIERSVYFRHSLKACDDALIQLITRWRRLLKADYPKIENRNLSAFFNALILIRGCEDRDLNRSPGTSRVLLDAVNATSDDSIDIVSLLANSLYQTGVEVPLSEFIPEQAIEPLRNLDRSTAFNLFKELYTPRDAAYDFNFALMSKHALSKIYEKYVALLHADESISERQLSFISAVPVEVVPYKSGAVYTPQFIAGFFARFIRDNTTPKRFRELLSIDPACGSGIFLRTLLELQCDPFVPGTTLTTIQRAFAQTDGIDKDPNACEATRLSLALLHLIATGNLPRADSLHVWNGDAIAAALEGRLTAQSFGAVLTNPPYVKLDHLTADEREVYRRYVGIEDIGRIDAYIPFVRLSLDLVETDGFVCLVLPQVFLTASNATALRRKISEEFDVRCLADLSAVPVFEGLGTYTILLILQRRRDDHPAQGVPAMIAQVTEGVGAALQACLAGTTVSTPYHSVFLVGQRFFQSKQWILVSPEQAQIDDRLKDLPRLSSFMDVRQGFVTGADDVFIIPKRQIPKGEEKIYVDYLPDRQIARYRLPMRTDRALFFPYIGDEQLTEDDLQSKFPQTWSYLVAHREKLAARRSVTLGNVPWWRPARPREPSKLLRPKIVCPHLMLTPRFAVDKLGTFAVSHGPFVIVNDEGDEQVLLRFFCAVLNSSVCNWHLRTYAPKYGRGYNRLEVALLKGVPVPDLSRINAGDLARVVALADKLSAGDSEALDQELDEVIAGLFGFTPGERKTLFRMG